MIRVVIADDQELIRTGLRTILDSHPEVQVTGEVADGIAAVAIVDREPVDVVLMDLRMPGIDGVEATRRIRERHEAQELRIIVLTTFDQDENVLRALQAGADGFLSKGVGPSELLTAILATAKGENVLSSTAVNAVVGHLAESSAAPVDQSAVDKLDLLTPREREVVECIVSGLSNAEIAEQMYLSPFTVKTHANRAMTKVGVRDRAQLVTLAVRAGIRP